MKNKPKVTVKCETHKVYYCLKTGGLRCRRCKVLLNDYGNEYKKSNNMKCMELKADYDMLKDRCEAAEKVIESMECGLTYFSNDDDKKQHERVYNDWVAIKTKNNENEAAKPS